MTINPPPPYDSYQPQRTRGLWWFIGAIAVIGGVGLVLSATRSKAPPAPPPVPISVAAVAQGAIPITVEAVGTVVAYESVAVRSRIDSQVVRVHFKDGDAVKKGDLLFELDDSTLRAESAQLSANIARDKAQLENARQQEKRASALAEKGFATKAVRDDSRANAQVAEATLGASHAALDNIRAQLAYTRITAPISGRTGTINVTLGNMVRAGDVAPLVTINQVKPIRVQASLPQHLFDAVRSAMKAGSVTVTAMKQGETSAEAALATGTLEYLDNSVDQSTGTFVTRARFDNPEERLWPGMFVTLTMTLGEDRAAIHIPEVAVQHGQAGDYVYVIAEGKAVRRPITVARMQRGIAVIKDGVTPGESVAVDGLLGLKDGASVSIKTKPEAGSSP